MKLPDHINDADMTRPDDGQWVVIWPYLDAPDQAEVGQYREVKERDDRIRCMVTVREWSYGWGEVSAWIPLDLERCQNE